MPKRVDKRLVDKLRGEKAGILEWMLGAGRCGRLGGLPQCAAIERETESYLDGADVFGRWMGRRWRGPGGQDAAPHQGFVALVGCVPHGEGAWNSAPNDVTRLIHKAQEAGFAVDRDNKGAYVDGISVTKT